MTATQAAPTFKPVRTLIPAPLDARDWSALEPLFRELLARPVSDQPGFEQWLIDRSELDAACAQTQANLYISMTCSTDDKSAAEAYSNFMESIPPKIKPLAFELDKKVVALAATLRPDERRFGVMVRDLKADVDLFRPENVEIETALDKLSQEYETIAGAHSHSTWLMLRRARASSSVPGSQGSSSSLSTPRASSWNRRRPGAARP